MGVAKQTQEGCVGERAGAEGGPGKEALWGEGSPRGWLGEGAKSLSPSEILQEI